jgi:hypothetical protein
MTFENSNWKSIYVKNAGAKSSVDSIEIAFSMFGEINRVDIIDFTRPDGSSGKNAFIHFVDWNANQQTTDLRKNLETIQTNKETSGYSYVYNGWKFFLFINENPIQITPMNPFQLTQAKNTQDEIIKTQTEKIAALEFEITEIKLILSGRSLSKEF